MKPKNEKMFNKSKKNVNKINALHLLPLRNVLSSRTARAYATYR